LQFSDTAKKFPIKNMGAQNFNFAQTLNFSQKNFLIRRKFSDSWKFSGAVALLLPWWYWSNTHDIHDVVYKAIARNIFRL